MPVSELIAVAAFARIGRAVVVAPDGTVAGSISVTDARADAHHALASVRGGGQRAAERWPASAAGRLAPGPG